MAGFGGVAEYGITVRWDKNFLKVIRLLLERRAQFAHVRRRALRRHARPSTTPSRWASTTSRCARARAGRRCSTCPNGLARGVRTASDFLMALQLTGAAKRESIANMQVRLPVVVIGGGLTAIDTATESLAYYPVQVEKFLARYEALVREHGDAAVRTRGPRRSARSPRSSSRMRARSAPSARAAPRRREPRIVELLQSWGGVDDRLSPAADRQPVVHAEPRGSREGAGGRHPLRRRPDAARDRGRRVRPRAGCACRCSARRRRRWHESRRRCRRARS